MKETANALDEVVVVGYGRTRKSQRNRLRFVDEGFGHRRPRSGFRFSSHEQVDARMWLSVQSSGAPGGQTGTVTIRGNNSVNSASPLVIVDGVSAR